MNLPTKNIDGIENNLFDEQKLLLGDYTGINFPVIFSKVSGHELADILDTGWPGLYLISDHFLDCLIQNQLSGWDRFEVLIENAGQRVLGYHGLSVKGRSGPIVFENSEVVEKQFVPNGPITTYYKGYEVLENDGSDFFIPSNYLGITMSGLAGQVLKKNKISNLRMECLAEVELSSIIVERIKSKTTW